jgi:subtilisin family serine protease
VANNGRGVTGVSWNVQIMALKFMSRTGFGWVSDAIECLEYATLMKMMHGVDIKLTNNSWGGGKGFFSQALHDAIDAAGQAGILFVAAAGNAGKDIDLSPVYPASYDLPHVVSVASTNHGDGLSGFSNYGATSVDLGAPSRSPLL